MTEAVDLAPPGRKWFRLPLRLVKWLAVGVLVFVPLYYLGGALLLHEIDDDPKLELPADATGSRAVAMAAALLDREINGHAWVANDPWFLPGAVLDNMPNYQQGVVQALARFAFTLADQLGRLRGSSQTDNDLQRAAGQLQYPGTIWVFDLSSSFLPTESSESRYQGARKALLAYNARLARGEAVLDRRADNLQAALDRVALDLGASSAAIEQHIAQHSGQFLDARADNLFYGVKGQLYAYSLLLRELGQDFANVVKDRELAAVWQEMLASLVTAAALQPLVVVNGVPDSQWQPSHLAAQGFYLLRARTKLREITTILEK